LIDICNQTNKLKEAANLKIIQKNYEMIYKDYKSNLNKNIDNLLLVCRVKIYENNKDNINKLIMESCEIK
jgi:hypothetical protein